LLQGISGGIQLGAQRHFRHVLHGHRLAEQLLALPDDIERAQCLRPAQPERAACRIRSMNGSGREGCDVQEGNPADRVLAVAEDLRPGIREVEPEHRTEPDLHEAGRLQDHLNHAAAPQPVFDGALGIL
jgi:hypothetical protein